MGQKKKKSRLGRADEDRRGWHGGGGSFLFLPAEQCTALELSFFFQIIIIKFSLNVVSFLIR
jgi:hypothetical protein